MNLFLGSAVAVMGVEAVGHIHAFYDFSKGGEPLFVESAIIVVVDKDLCGSAMRLGTLCKGDGAFSVGHANGIVSKRPGSPFLSNFRATGNSKLRNERGEDTKDANVIVVSIYYESSKSFGSQGGPLRMYFHNETSLCGIEVNAKWFRNVFLFWIFITSKNENHRAKKKGVPFRH